MDAIAWVLSTGPIERLLLFLAFHFVLYKINNNINNTSLIPRTYSLMLSESRGAGEKWYVLANLQPILPEKNGILPPEN